MTDQINPMTGAPDIWSEPAPAAAPNGNAQLAAWIEQQWRNTADPTLASHPALTETAERLASEGKLRLDRGVDGVKDFFAEVTAALKTPEANGMGGMLGELAAEQAKLGLY